MRSVLRPENRAFADHHGYTSSDLREIAEAAAGSGADLLVTTEKDAVRLPGDLPDIPVSVWGYRLAAREPNLFLDWLMSHAGLTPQTNKTAEVST